MIPQLTEIDLLLIEIMVASIIFGAIYYLYKKIFKK